MSEEELNQELSTDEIKDVAGGLTDSAAQAKVRFRNKYELKGHEGHDHEHDPVRGDLLGKKGRKQTEALDATQFGNLRPK